MAVEAIQKVSQLEHEANQRKEAAVVDGKQKILLAQRAAQRMLEEAQLHAEEEARQTMVAAEAQAEEVARGIMAQARQDSQIMKQQASQRLEHAAQLIVEKVVNR